MNEYNEKNEKSEIGEMPEHDTGFDFETAGDRHTVPRLRAPSPLLRWLGYGGFMMFGVVLLYAIWMPNSPQAARERPRDKMPRIDPNVPAITLPVFEKEAPPPAPAPLEIIASAHAEPPLLTPLEIPPPAAASIDQAATGTPASSGEPEDPFTRRLNSPLSVADAGTSGVPLANHTSPPTAGSVPARRPSTATSSAGVDLAATATAPFRAHRLADQIFTVPKGTFANCVMTTAIQTDQPGFTECRLMRDIYGADGSVILLDKGSTVSGEYKPGSFALGKERIAIVWTRIRTPSGVVVTMASPGTGPLGRAGVAGSVNHHYGLRYGVPILISLVEQAAQFANAAVGKNGSQNQVFSTATSSVSEILSENANIAPTLYKNQGAIVSIIFADDVDFSGVYQLSVR